MHELNNPAAATVRATAALRERMAAHAYTSSPRWPATRSTVPSCATWSSCRRSVIARLAKAPKLSPIETSDREDELSDWLDAHRVDGGWDLAPVLVSSGMDVECLEDIAGKVDPDLLDKAIRWLTYTLETEMLMGEIEDASARISTLVGAAKQYSQMDRAAHQWIDVHEGLKSTLVMLQPQARGRHRGGEGLRPHAAQDPGLPGRAQPGVDEHHRQRGPGDGGPGQADRPHQPGGRLGAGRHRRHRARHARRGTPAHLRAVLHHQAGRARAPASAWTSRTGSSSTGTVATSTSPRAPATPTSSDPPAADRAAGRLSAVCPVASTVFRRYARR